jgi:hypothetical protein
MGKPCMGWTGFAAGGLAIVELPVYPGGMFVEPYVRVLAEKLRACLDEAEKPGGCSRDAGSKLLLSPTVSGAKWGNGPASV